MSYDVDELFLFKETYGGYAVEKYLKANDPSVTRVEIPAEYHDFPVEAITEEAFEGSDYLREVFVPDSVEWVESWAFYNCPELRAIRLPKRISIEPDAFLDCPKLAAETVVMGLVCSTDITLPVDLFIFMHDAPSERFRPGRF